MVSISGRIFLVATLVAMLLPSGLAVTAPSPQQVLDETCVRADGSGTAQVVAPPAAAFGPSWAPRCVVIPNGGTVVFTQADGIPHGAASDASCFDLGRMLAGQQTRVKLELFEKEDGGMALASLGNGAALGDCGDVDAEAQALVIPYHCTIHGSAMPGRIIVELQ